MEPRHNRAQSWATPRIRHDRPIVSYATYRHIVSYSQRQIDYKYRALFETNVHGTKSLALSCFLSFFLSVILRCFATSFCW